MELVHNLGLKREKIEHTVSGIGKTKQHITSAAYVNIQSNINSFQVNTWALTVAKITGDLPMKVISDEILQPTNITLANPYFNISNKIDMLIGAEHFYDRYTWNSAISTMSRWADISRN